MRRKRKVYVIIILLMAIGFATVATNLFVNGTTYISSDDDFLNSVIFTKASVDIEGVANISNNNKSLSFTTGNLKSIDDVAIIRYTVTNLSTNYDADVDVVCDIVTADGNELINIDNNLNNILSANSSENGILTVSLKKAVIEPIDIVIDCEIDAVAISRDTIPDDNDNFDLLYADIYAKSSINDFELMNYESAVNSKLVPVFYSETPKVMKSSYYGDVYLEEGEHEVYLVDRTQLTLEIENVLSSYTETQLKDFLENCGDYENKESCALDKLIGKSYILNNKIASGTFNTNSKTGFINLTISNSNYIDNLIKDTNSGYDYSNGYGIKMYTEIDLEDELYDLYYSFYMTSSYSSEAIENNEDIQNKISSFYYVLYDNDGNSKGYTIDDLNFNVINNYHRIYSFEDEESYVEDKYYYENFFNNLTDSEFVKFGGDIISESKNIYNLVTYLYYDDEYYNYVIEFPDEILGQKIDGYTYNSKESINLYNKIVSLSSGKTINNFSINSNENNTNGIYETNDTDSGNKVYYYRGDVNNNIVFGDSCYKIVRTTETNGIKLLYTGGVDSNNRCVSPNYNKNNLNIIQNNDIYMYGDGDNYYSENKYSSEAKVKNDTWYENNILNNNLAGYIEDTVYCVNRNLYIAYMENNEKVYSFETNYIKTKYYNNRGEATIVGDYDATLKCVNNDNADSGIDRFTVSTSNGNGNLTYPVGLLSTNEAFYGGATESYYSSYEMDYDLRKGYLWDYDYHYLLADPAYYRISSSETTKINRYFDSLKGITYTHGITVKIRPVISLKTDTQIYASGDGTKKNPYRVILNQE